MLLKSIQGINNFGNTYEKIITILLKLIQGINNFGNKCVKKYYDAIKINTGHK